MYIKNVIKPCNLFIINIIYKLQGRSYKDQKSRAILAAAVACLFCLIAFLPGLMAQREVNIELNTPVNRTLIRVNLPDSLHKMNRSKPVLLVFYALPNGNSIDWTMGKPLQAGDDWHFDIQHIAAQTRFVRQVMSDQQVVVVYLCNELKSWPAWKKQQANGPAEIRRIVDSISGMFSHYQAQTVLSSHSGGGSFLFGYLDAVDQIPQQVTRLVFMDSDYGYNDTLHTQKLVQWLKGSRKAHLNILAYNDSVVIYNGKPLVSPTGGTWYRTRLMLQQLSKDFRFDQNEDSAFLNYHSLSNRIDIRLKTNIEGKIYHTEQVARNGFIHTLLSGTRYEKSAGYQYWGERAYQALILPQNKD